MKLTIVRQQSNEPEFLNQLNPAQKQAAITVQGPVLIIAGAGSGKTRALTYRIAYLLATGIAPQHILALTFTNKAAGEMKERIAAMVGQDTARRVWAGTFHSIFARILRGEAEQIGYTPSFSIYDSDDSLSIIRSVMNTLGISQQQFTPQSIRSRISNAKNQMMSWQAYSAQAGDLPEKQTGLIYQEYEKRLRQNNAMDFDDLLLNFIKLLQLHPEIRQRYQNLFQYIMVDEYQDTNRAQYMAVNLLAAGHRNLCVVGDDAQSIYRWRGADIRNILDFQKDFPEAIIVRLEQNYRSTKTIIEAAGNVISRNSKQLPKELWTENQSGDPITVMGSRDDREEAEVILKALREETEKRFLQFKDVALLYRTNAQSQALEDALRRAGIPYTIIGGTSFYKRKEIKDTLAYLRLLTNPDDSESLMRIINEPARGLGPASLKRFQEFSIHKNISLFEAFTRSAEVPDTQKRAQQSARDFTLLINRYRDLMYSTPPAELAVAYIEATGLLRILKDENTDESMDRWNNIQRLLSHIAEMSAREESLTLEQYLQHIALISDVDESELSQNRVALMTMHAAKGLEFPLVFIAGMERGLFPMGRAEGNPEEEEEERRLFYVGITRAELKLFLTYAERRYRFGELVFSEPSKFIREISPNLLEWRTGGLNYRQNTGNEQARPVQKIVEKRIPSRPEHNDYYRDSIPDSSSEYSQIPVQQIIKPGCKVKHAQFGIGTVQALAGEGEKKQALVNFQTAGRKQLLLKYAKLEVMS
jgi:DNA helicase-2/ATP-dependent DNA helicase PcrA